ncbi:MAG: SGNH/GDSL hydrolase family protein [Planctomycetes bacterium]|nr:SGNH/GDSL hydrolase family protein [Planctomycetota bacterium]
MKRVVERLLTEPMTRIVALGSSNTERAYHCQGAHNWFDWLEVGIRGHYGRRHIMVNAGVSGQTTDQLLERFDRDVATFAPDAVIVTAGGNDSNPQRDVPPERFRGNLQTLADRIGGLADCAAIFQTYYSFDVEHFGAEEAGWAENFPVYMQIVRETAAAAGIPLVDHLPRWENLRMNEVETFRRMMRDTRHVNPLGNMVIGLDVLRRFGARVQGELEDFCAEGLAIQRQMDKLEQNHDEGKK